MFLENSNDGNIINLLKSAICYQLHKNNISYEEKTDYISTEIIDFYVRDNCCYVVTNPLLNIKYGKEFKFNKIKNDTSSEKIVSLADTIVKKCLLLTIGDLLIE